MKADGRDVKNAETLAGIPCRSADRNPVASGMCLGMCFGLSLGLLLNNLAVCLSIGMCLGVAVGSAMKRRADNGEKADGGDERRDG